LPKKECKPLQYYEIYPSILWWFIFTLCFHRYRSNCPSVPCYSRIWQICSVML